ncbi:kelch domain-containing protein 7A isoform X1 [Arvicanthis niloticus]|uniref:kelch domain-containing protein 7A isoform X1 n=1 Tax=Arvicanthis niloticus TaxID=61156 RepID=UPI0014863FD6|nr:kelch domain-containing protein 7A [Arvicanthis niloticus]
MLPTRKGTEAHDWHLDMQLTSKVVLSAAALLLVTAAYKLYKCRLAPAGQAGRNNKGHKAENETEGLGQPAFQEAPPGTLPRGPRRRKPSKGAGAPLDYSLEDPEDSCILDTFRSGESIRKGSEESQGRQQRPDSQQLSPPCGGQEAGRDVRGKSNPPHLPHSGCEPTSSPSRLVPGVGGSCVGDKLSPWPDGRPPEETGSGDPEALSCWTDPTLVNGDMNQSWIFTHVTGVSKGEAGALQAAADMGLATQQQEGATNASHTFSSVARIRMEENIIQKAEGPELKGRVYDYFVESTSKAVSRPVPCTATLADAPPPAPGPEPLVTGVASRDQDESEVASPKPVPPASAPGFSRKVSLLQIAENPELQLQPEGIRMPLPAHLDQRAQLSSACKHGEPHVRLVAGTNFFHMPLTRASALDVRLDLGNCYEVLTLAKRQGLEALKEAAYKVLSDNYLQVLRSTDIYGGLSGAERELILQRRFRGHKCLVVADMCPQEDSGRLCCYDNVQDVWHPLAQLPQEAMSRGCALCTLFNYLFVVSGCQGPRGQPSNRVFCYNPLTAIWSEVCPLNQARPHCRLVALEGHLYAIGGECLNTVERYDPRLDRWTFAPPLPNDTFALAHTATVCANEIFVTGGSLRYLLLRFSTQEQRWWAGPTGGSKDRTAEMVAVNGFLYRFDLNRSLGISVYRCNASTRLWYECATYRLPYPDAFQCAVVDDRIYCVGRRRMLCFLADHISPRFVPKELQGFPSARGTLLPAVLTLPVPDVPQTPV